MNLLSIKLLTLCSLLSICVNIFAKTNNPTEEILSLEMKQAAATIEKLHAAADLIDNSHHIGTAYNEVDGKEHFCYSRGMLLDLGESVRHLKINRNPVIKATNSYEAHSLRVNAQSLENFIHATKYALNLTHQERALEWNLDCVGQLKIKGNLISTDKINTFYQLKHDGKVLQILGNIEKGFSDKLRTAVESNPNIKVVALGSGGGLINEALKAGRYIRSKNLETTLWNNCFSACPLVFLAGTQRTIMSPYPYLGFHKIYINTGAVPHNSPIYHEVATYITQMGASSRYILDKMLGAEPNQMLILRETEDMCKYGLTTWIQRVC